MAQKLCTAVLCCAVLLCNFHTTRKVFLPACLSVCLHGRLLSGMSPLCPHSHPQLPRPRSLCAGKLTWVLDQNAASGLRVADWALGSKAFPRSSNPPKPADA